MGQEDLVKLQKQTEDIARIKDNVDDIRDMTKVAGRVLRSIVVRYKTDKLLTCFTFLVIAGIVGCVVYKQMYPDTELNAPKDVMPGSGPAPAPAVRLLLDTITELTHANSVFSKGSPPPTTR
jgi:hypothetical protein